jgi:FkbM family methyltransferase
MWHGLGYGSHSIRREVASLRRFVKGGIFLDVGANKGLYSRELLRVYGPNVEALHCFEPTKELVSGFLRFEDPRVTVNALALGKRAATAELWKIPGRPGLNSLTKRRLDHFQVEMTEKDSVEVVTLDEYAARHNLEHIDFMKLDVEGHELDVLKGSEALLSRRAIRCIQFEFGGCNIDTRTFFQDFWYLLGVNYGFRLYRIAPLGIIPVTRYTEADEVFLTTNYIAVLAASRAW